MANVDAPIGFWPVRHLTGGEIRTNEYIVTTGSTIYRGDLLKVVAAGTVEPSSANDGVIVIGVAAEYVSDSGSAGGKKIKVYDDPYIVFGCQMDDVGTASTSASVFATANHLAGSGSATTLMSGHELDMSDIGTGGQLQILGLCNTRDYANNDWGGNADVEVRIAEHLFNAAVAGV